MKEEILAHAWHFSYRQTRLDPRTLAGAFPGRGDGGERGQDTKSTDLQSDEFSESCGEERALERERSGQRE